MTVAEFIAALTEETTTQKTILDFGNFLNHNYKDLKLYKFNDSNGDTYVVLKWPHKVPQLKVIQ